MPELKTLDHKKTRTSILGVRMTAEMESQVKAEALRLKLSVAQLFEDIWQTYKGAIQKK